jgi:hypothetical protein
MIRLQADFVLGGNPDNVRPLETIEIVCEEVRESGIGVYSVTREGKLIGTIRHVRASGSGPLMREVYKLLGEKL